jgi:hypothetical protein
MPFPVLGREADSRLMTGRRGTEHPHYAIRFRAFLDPDVLEVVYRVAEIERRPTSHLVHNIGSVWAKARRPQIDQKEVTA